MDFTVRGGGHSLGGFSLWDNALMISFRKMRSVHVDTTTKRAVCDPGCRLADVDRETELHGLVFPAGQVPETGLCGLALGGGYGPLWKKYGLSCENILSFQIMTWDGTLLTCSEDENSDLFWAQRGSGGNYGVIISLTLQLYELSSVVGGNMIFDWSKMEAVLPHVAKTFEAKLPANEQIMTILAIAPPHVIPMEAPERRVCIVRPCKSDSSATLEEGIDFLKPFMEIGPVMSTVSRRSYANYNAELDEMAHWGMPRYMKAFQCTHLSVEHLQKLADYLGSCPSPIAVMLIEDFSRDKEHIVDSAANMSDNVSVAVEISWLDPSTRQACVEWARNAGKLLEDVLTKTLYVNFVGEAVSEDVKEASFGQDKLERLRAIKRKYDPENRFCHNHNIAP